MVLDKTMEIVNRYYKSHKVPNEKIGVGNLIQSGNFQIDATPDGGMFLRITQEGSFRDCYVAAVCLKEDIELNNPELEPKIRQYRSDGNQQNFVAVTCPHTDEEVFIDTTPWANSVHTPYPESVEIEGNLLPTGVPLRFGHNIPFSVRRANGEVTSVGISGYLPKIAEGALLKGLDYALIFTLSRETNFDQVVKNPWRFFIGIEDIDKFTRERAKLGAFEIYTKTDMFFGVLNTVDGKRSRVSFDELFEDRVQIIQNRRLHVQFQDAIRIAAKICMKTERRLEVPGFGRKIDIRENNINPIEALMKYQEYVNSINRKVNRERDAKKRFV